MSDTIKTPSIRFFSTCLATNDTLAHLLLEINVESVGAIHTSIH